MSQDEEVVYHLDVSTFQRPLWQLAEVLAQKVRREAPKVLVAPQFVSVDLHVLVRQAMTTYNLLFYLNADERRETDCYWNNAYGVAVLPLIRNMIDCLHNITVILQAPGPNGIWFRKSGFRKALRTLDEEQRRYGGKPRWDVWLQKARDGFDLLIRACGFSVADVWAQREPWPTLGQYLGRKQPGGTLTKQQEFMQTFLLGNWHEYSAMAHGAFEGLQRTAMYHITDSFPHDERETVEEAYSRVLSVHIPRAAGVLLCIITELQAYFHFDGASIDSRLHAMWNALMCVPEVKDLYDERYSQLMAERVILPGI